MQMLQYELQNSKSLLLKLQPNNLETELSEVQNKNKYLLVKDLAINTIFYNDSRISLRFAST